MKMRRLVDSHLGTDTSGGATTKVRALRSVALTFTIAWAALGAAPTPDDPDGLAMLQAARRAIVAYHDGQSGGAVLRVVYFHPSDRDPLPGYTERLDRVLKDVSNFYRDGLRRFGIENDGLPFELKDGRLVLHVVRGKKPASDYRYDSGAETAAEIRAALKGTVDLDREHVLVLYGLCRKEPDGRYVFDAPYYGSGSQSNGLAHAADCELLDPALLTETKKTIVYTEHYYPRVEQTVAQFNSWYLGGLAHELGHGLGLAHDSGNSAEQRFGTSLMGSGNHTYRQEVWGGGKPTYLSRGSALQLLSHPLFTGSNRGRWDGVRGGFQDLSFSAEGGVLHVRGEVVGEIAPYAVVAYVWPASNKSDHAAFTFPLGLNGGAFDLALSGLRRDTYNLRLASLHANGGTSTWDFRFGFDFAGRPDAAKLTTTWRNALAERAEKAVLQRWRGVRNLVSDDNIAHAPTSEAQRKLRVLRAVLDPAPPLDLARVTGDRVFLSDVAWTSAKVGWGQPARNHYWFDDDIQDGVFLLLGREFFDKGLYAHSPSRYVFQLRGNWKTFIATIGLRDGANPDQGSAVFTVRGDGRELYRSPILRPGSRRDVKVEIAGVNELELIAEGGEGHPHNSWAIWAEPALRR